MANGFLVGPILALAPHPSPSATRHSLLATLFAFITRDSPLSGRGRWMPSWSRAWEWSEPRCRHCRWCRRSSTRGGRERPLDLSATWLAIALLSMLVWISYGSLVAAPAIVWANALTFLQAGYLLVV